MADPDVSLRVSIALIVVSAIIIALAVPLVRGAVRRNALYGFRTRSTMSDDRIWYPANRAAGWALLWSGVFTLLCNALALLHVVSLPVPALMGTHVLSIVLACVYSAVQLGRIQRTALHHRRPPRRSRSRRARTPEG